MRTPISSLIALIVILLSNSTINACYSSMFSFGDSLTDTGNLLHLSSSPISVGFPPYGETYFHHATGRFSDGRLIIDFIAEYLGLPYVKPYFGHKNFGDAVNFAVSGATVLGTAFYEERGIYDKFTKYSLEAQLGWFKDTLSSLCHTSSDCTKNLLKSSVVVMGEIGGNDYNHPMVAGRNVEEIQSFLIPVVNSIGSTIHEIIKLGVVTVMVPGVLPIGCLPSMLTHFMSFNKKDYDPSTGCLIWLNKFAQKHNELLRIELTRIQQLHPHVTIIYADYYNAAMQLYRSPKEYGFTKGALLACCGGKGPYNYNSSVYCGTPPSSHCDDPWLYVSWDGTHFTEAASKWIAKGLFEGPFTTPRFNTLCVPPAATTAIV